MSSLPQLSDLDGLDRQGRPALADNTPTDIPGTHGSHWDNGGIGYTWVTVIDILNKDCRRSISAILTWVLENVKISMRPLNSIGN